MKILVTIEQFNPEAKKVLEQVGEVEYRSVSQDELDVVIQDQNYDAIIVGLGLYLGKALIKTAPSLGLTRKFIATATTGRDHIDYEYDQGGYSVLTLKEEDLKKVTGTAEHALFLLGSLIRKIPFAFEDVKNGNWSREKFLGHNLSDNTLGIVGIGRLGSMMARYGKALGMNVIAYDPYKDTSDTAQLVNFETLLLKSDIISIHAPLTKETTNLFNVKAFSQMKETAYLINTARGAIVNEADVLAALENKTIAGYAADVLAGETEFGKDASNHPLVKYAREHDNVIITPHIGGYTAESRAATDVIIARKVASALS